jgi:hypothetical protein
MGTGKGEQGLDKSEPMEAVYMESCGHEMAALFLALLAVVS